MKFVVYDIETLKDCITLCFLNYETKEKKSFVLYDDIQEFIKLLKFLRGIRKYNYNLVGYNNLGFDAQLIEYILWIVDNEQPYDVWTIEEIVTAIYNKSQEIIHLPDEEKFKVLIPEWKLTISQIDLYKQKHYDRPQKATSLKWLEFTMRRRVIKEMPIPHDAFVTKEDIESILEYNWEDVDATAEFFEKIMFETDLRISLSEKFDLKLLNASEPRMARDIFGKFLSEEMEISYSDIKKMQTWRSSIIINDIIFPYVKFKNPIFNELLNELRSKVLGADELFERIIKVYNIEATFALGGLHSNNKSLIVEADEDHIILTSDVKSMYPNLAIENNLKPAHLGDVFNKVYKSIYNERLKYDKKDPINYVYKIILNSTYGLSSEKNSYLYDVQFTRSICINGELSLLMLCEIVKDKIPEAEFIMLNTDGIEVKIPKDKKELYAEACKEWEGLTKLILEHGEYKKMIINNCNNYIAVDIKDNIKKKGLFETELDYHKNPSFLVVPLALEQYFVHGKDYVRFIMNHENIFDFCGAVKKKSNFELNLYALAIKKELPKFSSLEEIETFLSENGFYQIAKDAWRKEEWQGELAWVNTKEALNIVSNHIDYLQKTPQQKVCRFIVSNTGGTLKKDFNDGRQTSIIAGKYVTPLDIIDDTNAKNYNINMNWYISEVRKIVFELEKNKAQLKLF